MRNFSGRKRFPQLNIFISNDTMRTSITINTLKQKYHIFNFSRYSRESTNLVITQFEEVDTYGDLCCEIQVISPSESQRQCTKLLSVGK